jgi:hypothetical protein
LLIILAAHRLLSIARLHPALGGIFDHRVRVLLSNGTPDVRQLRCGLTAGDLHSALRQRNVDDLAAVRYVLYEPNGALTIVCHDRSPSAPLLAEAVADAIRTHTSRPSVRTSLRTRTLDHHGAAASARQLLASRPYADLAWRSWWRSVECAAPGPAKLSGSVQVCGGPSCRPGTEVVLILPETPGLRLSPARVA